VLVALRAPRLARHGDDTVDLQELAHDVFAHAFRFRKRRTGDKRHKHGERIFVERREEAGSELGAVPDRHAHQRGREEDHQLGETDSQGEERRVDRLERPHHDRRTRRGLLSFPSAFPSAPDEKRQRGRDEKGRRDRAGEDREIGVGERLEELALHAVQEEEREEDDDDDEARKRDAGRNFERGGEYLRLRVSARPPLKYLREDDGAVDDVAHGDGQPTERHDVDAKPHDGEEEQPHADADRHRKKNDHQRAKTHQRNPQHDDYDQHRSAHHVASVGDGEVDEVGLPVGVLFDPDTWRQREAVQRILDLFREFKRVAARRLLHGDDHRVPSVERGAAATRRACKRDVCDRAEADRRAVRVRHPDRGEVRRRVGPRNLAHGKLLALDVCKVAAARPGAGRANGLREIVDAEPVLRELARRVADAEFRQVPADRDDLCDAGDGEQAISERILRNLAQGKAGHVRRFGDERDHHDLARDGDNGGDFRFSLLRQRFTHLPQPFEHAEAGRVGVGRPVEVHPHEGESAARTRAYLRDALESVHGGLDRHGDALLHFFGRKPARLRLYGDARHLDVGKDVHREALGDIGAATHERQRQKRSRLRPLKDDRKQLAERTHSLSSPSAWNVPSAWKCPADFFSPPAAGSACRSS